MFKLIGRLLGALVFGWAGSASSAMLPPVIVNGQEWLQPFDFINFSWNDISSKCDATTGACIGTLGATDVTGYTWAGVIEVNGLFNAYLTDAGFSGGSLSQVPGGRTERGSLWAPAFLEDFNPLDCVAGPSGQCRISGLLRQLNGSGLARLGTLQDGTAEDRTDSVASDQLTGTATASSIRGGWFFRADQSPPSGVPTPSTIFLLGLGLLVLLARSKRAI